MSPKALAISGVLFLAAGVTLDETYPAPICDHAARRQLAVALYRAAGQSKGAVPEAGA